MINIPLHEKYNGYNIDGKSPRIAAVYLYTNNQPTNMANYNWLRVDYDITKNCTIAISSGKIITETIDLFNSTYNKNVTLSNFVLSNPKPDGITIDHIIGLNKEELVMFKLMVF